MTLYSSLLASYWVVHCDSGSDRLHCVTEASECGSVLPTVSSDDIRVGSLSITLSKIVASFTSDDVLMTAVSAGVVNIAATGLDGSCGYNIDAFGTAWVSCEVGVRDLCIVIASGVGVMVCSVAVVVAESGVVVAIAASCDLLCGSSVAGSGWWSGTDADSWCRVLDYVIISSDVDAATVMAFLGVGDVRTV